MNALLIRDETFADQNAFVEIGGHYAFFCLFVCLFVFVCFQSQKIQQFSEVVSVACCLFAQYSKEELLSSVTSSSIARNPVHKRKGRGFQEINSCSYARLFSVATKYESDDCLKTCCKLKPTLHVTVSPWSLYKQPQQYDTGHI